jgi:hypothetical protein
MSTPRYMPLVVDRQKRSRQWVCYDVNLLFCPRTLPPRVIQMPQCYSGTLYAVIGKTTASRPEGVDVCWKE